MSADRDDPKLTAYALDELRGEERKALESSLERKGGAKDEVEDISESAELLRRSFILEEIPLKPRTERFKVIERRLWEHPQFWQSAAAVLVISLVTLALVPWPEAENHVIAGAADEPPAVRGLGLEETTTPEFRVRVLPNGDWRYVPPEGTVDREVAVAANAAEEEPGTAESGRAAIAEPGRGKEPARQWVSRDYVPWPAPVPAAERLSEGFRNVIDQKISTFPLYVGTDSFELAKESLAAGRLPESGEIRVEEFVNAFPYDYPQPGNGEPISVNLEMAACPWDPEHRLVRIGLRGDKDKLNVRNVRAEVAFNPLRVAWYRLLGFESRLPGAEDLASGDFSGVSPDSGRTLTALYEIVPLRLEDRSEETVGRIVNGRYASLKPEVFEIRDPGVLTLRLTYERGTEATPRIQESQLTGDGKSMSEASEDFRLATAAAALALRLANAESVTQFGYADMARLVTHKSGFGAAERELLGLLEAAARAEEK